MKSVIWVTSELTRQFSLAKFHHNTFQLTRVNASRVFYICKKFHTLPEKLSNKYLGKTNKRPILLKSNGQMTSYELWLMIVIWLFFLLLYWCLLCGLTKDICCYQWKRFISRHDVYHWKISSAITWFFFSMNFLYRNLILSSVDIWDSWKC